MVCGKWLAQVFHLFCFADRGHPPLQEPVLLPIDSVEDRFLMDLGSYNDVSAADSISHRVFLFHQWLLTCLTLTLFRTWGRRHCSYRGGPCGRHAAASHTSSRVWGSRCPAVTPATPATAASSMLYATVAKWATTAQPDEPDAVFCQRFSVSKKLHPWNNDQ